MRRHPGRCATWARCLCAGAFLPGSHIACGQAKPTCRAHGVPLHIFGTATSAREVLHSIAHTAAALPQPRPAAVHSFRQGAAYTIKYLYEMTGPPASYAATLGVVEERLVSEGGPPACAAAGRQLRLLMKLAESAEGGSCRGRKGPAGTAACPPAHCRPPFETRLSLSPSMSHFVCDAASNPRQRAGGIRQRAAWHPCCRR